MMTQTITDNWRATVLMLAVAAASGCGSIIQSPDGGSTDSGVSTQQDAGADEDAGHEPLGPPTQSDLTFTNKSTNDLLFHVMISVMETPGNWGQIHLPGAFDNGTGQVVKVRVNANEKVTVPNAFIEGADKPIAVAVYITTQGTTLPRFEGIRGCVGNALDLEFNYDSALAEYSLKWQWPYDPSRSDNPNTECDVAATWQTLTYSVPMCTAAHASCSGSSQCCSGLCCQGQCCSNGASCYFNVPGHTDGCSF